MFRNRSVQPFTAKQQNLSTSPPHFIACFASKIMFQVNFASLEKPQKDSENINLNTNHFRFLKMQKLFKLFDVFFLLFVIFFFFCIFASPAFAVGCFDDKVLVPGSFFAHLVGRTNFK